MSETNKIKVEICLGTTCYVLGSFRLSALEEQLPPELKETAQGGIAATDRGKEIAREIHKGA